jgi:hypothetical protein
MIAGSESGLEQILGNILTGLELGRKAAQPSIPANMAVQCDATAILRSKAE